MIIYLDMDGCIADFRKEFIKRAKRDPRINLQINWNTASSHALDDAIRDYFISKATNDKQIKAAKYRAKALTDSLISDLSFWTDLEWTSDGVELWRYCMNLRDTNRIKELNILSSPSNSPVSKEGKLIWLKRHGLTNHLDHIYIEQDKSKFAHSSDDILVDDTPKKIKGWVEAGGTGILHTSTTNTINELKNLGLDLG